MRCSVKHGLLAGRIVLADHEDEDPQQFSLLLDGLREDYQPQSTIETMLVERLAASFWRLRRAYRFEVEAITQANRPNPLADALDELAHLPPVPRGERILPPPHSLDCLIRYETMIDRELLRTMRQLDLRQRLRKIEQAPNHPDGASHWQQAASGTPAQSPQPQGERHGQAYLPMPPEGDCVPGRSVPRPCRTSLSRTLQAPDRPQVTASAVRGPKAAAQWEDAATCGSKQSATRRGKAPAPNEATATPIASSATRCERWSSSAGVMPMAIGADAREPSKNYESNETVGYAIRNHVRINRRVRCPRVMRLRIVRVDLGQTQDENPAAVTIRTGKTPNGGVARRFEARHAARSDNWTLRVYSSAVCKASTA